MLTIVFTILGATFASWSWASDAGNDTNVTFTIAADFSCGANGGGNITSANLAPASCTNTLYALQRTITTTITNSGSDSVAMDLWLTVNSIGSGLNTSNFRWALTTDSTTCSSSIVNQGTFQGKTANSTVTILSGATATTSTYYLYIWLDVAETATTSMNQSYSFTLGGSCTNEKINYVYTANLYNGNVQGENSVLIGQPISSSITTYTTSAAAITALETAYSTLNNGATANLPFFLRHTIGNGSLWCASGAGSTQCIFESQSECNANLSMFGPGFTCQENTFTGGVTESYVGFVITPQMVSDNPGMNAGTYTLKGGDFGRSFLTNAKTIYDAFGGVGCYSDSIQINTPYSQSYIPSPSSDFNCYVPGLFPYATSGGSVYANGVGSSVCYVDSGGSSYCRVNDFD